MGLFFGHDHIPFFIPGEFIEKVFLGIFPAVFLFCSEFWRNGEYRHQGVGVQLIIFDFVNDFLCVFDGFR